MAHIKSLFSFVVPPRVFPSALAVHSDLCCQSPCDTCVRIFVCHNCVSACGTICWTSVRPTPSRCQAQPRPAGPPPSSSSSAALKAKTNRQKIDCYRKKRLVIRCLILPFFPSLDMRNGSGRKINQLHICHGNQFNGWLIPPVTPLTG